MVRDEHGRPVFCFPTREEAETALPRAQETIDEGLALYQIEDSLGEEMKATCDIFYGEIRDRLSIQEDGWIINIYKSGEAFVKRPAEEATSKYPYARDGDVFVVAEKSVYMHGEAHSQDEMRSWESENWAKGGPWLRVTVSGLSAAEAATPDGVKRNVQLNASLEEV